MKNNKKFEQIKNFFKYVNTPELKTFFNWLLMKAKNEVEISVRLLKLKKKV